MAITDIPILSMLRTRMQWAQERQRVLAENVANADTPKFRALDLVPLKFDTKQQNPGDGPPLTTVSLVRTESGHLAGIEAAGLTGDQRAMQGHVDAMHKDMMRSMHLPDPSRPINHEAARTAVRPLQGVQSSVWIDRSNLLVMVGGGQYRSMATIDRVCLALEPLGDTLGVVVNLQDVTATTSEGADTLSRNCQLRAGERAMLQKKRQVDVLDPEVRKVFRAQQGKSK